MEDLKDERGREETARVEERCGKDLYGDQTRDGMRKG